jgi:uncharacterized protein YjbI with pentapeptide repeats
MDAIHSILDFLSLHKDGVKALRELILIVAAIFGLGFLWWRSRSLSKSANASEKQVELTEIGQINERYIKAVDQLGSDQLTIRLGGIYGLETVANLSPDFRRQVFDVLTAFVREKAKSPEPPYEDDWLPLLDVQAVISVVGRRDLDNEEDLKLNLSGSYLPTYRIEGEFSGTNFKSSNLRKANFERTECAKCNFGDCRLEGAVFNNSNCSNSNFSDSDLTHAAFINAYCVDTHFLRVDIEKANFFGADLSKCVFLNSTIKGTSFLEANCEDADFSSTTLFDTRFRKANCDSAQFGDAKLSNCDFTQASLKGANFIGATFEKNNRGLDEKHLVWAKR